MAIYINNNGTAKRMDGAGDGSLYAPVTSVATPENGNTASKPYAVGEMFIRNDKLCTCLVAIAQGGTFVKNTNYKEGDVGSVLTELNSKTSANNIQWVTLNIPSGTKYTIPNDGYLVLGFNTIDVKPIERIYCVVDGNNEQTHINLTCVNGGGIGMNNYQASLFVKAGMKVYNPDLGSHGVLSYAKLV